MIGNITMPQPLKYVRPNATIYIANDENFQKTIERRPMIGIRAIQVISSWSLVEFFLLKAYVELLGGPENDAADQFLALNSATKKREAIAGLKPKIPHQLHNLFDKMLSDVSSAEKFRDKLSHWVWGYSPDLDDHLLIVDPRKLVKHGPNASNTFCVDEAELTKMREENYRIARYGPSTIKPPDWPILPYLIPEGYPPFHFDENGRTVFY